MGTVQRDMNLAEPGAGSPGTDRLQRQAAPPASAGPGRHCHQSEETRVVPLGVQGGPLGGPLPPPALPLGHGTWSGLPDPISTRFPGPGLSCWCGLQARCRGEERVQRGATGRVLLPSRPAREDRESKSQPTGASRGGAPEAASDRSSGQPGQHGLDLTCSRNQHSSWLKNADGWACSGDAFALHDTMV